MDRAEVLKQVADKVIDGDPRGIDEVIAKALQAMIPPRDILEEGLMAGMRVVGRQFRDNDVYVPEVIMASRAMAKGIKLLRPFLADSFLGNRGKVVIGTVHYDLHDLGKSVVAIMLQGAGFAVVDLGVDIPASRFVEAVEKERPNILALSATLTTTLPYMREAVQAVRKVPAGRQIKVLVGGLPVTPSFAKSIGADAYGVDANVAVQKALAIMG
ncbi:MAG: corrinoid protein [Clostridia bacterium]|nr:corrinoid protein [Clostridia bacterium]